MNEVEKTNILIVDDKLENLIALEAILENPEVNIIRANSGNEALGLSLEYDFAIVLLDVQMPVMDGFETAELMRGNRRTKHVPIIFVTAINKEQHHIFKGYESGAVDYIFKPLDPDILKNKVNIFINLYQQKKNIENTNVELKAANKKILEQQEKLVEEERLKVLLQMAGTTAHELNQPLMVLLGNIELLELVKDDPQRIQKVVSKIQSAGDRISKTVKKIGQIRYDVTVKHDETTDIIKLDKDIKILSVEDSDNFFDLLVSIFSKNKNFKLFRAKSIKDAMIQLDQNQFDIILLDYQLPDGTGLDFLEKQSNCRNEIPVVVITGKGDEKVASSLLKAGAYDYLQKNNLNENLLFRTLHATLEKFGLKKEVEQSIKKMAEMSVRDQLTGLFNRRFMDQFLEKEVERSKRYKTDLSCLMLDLDFFKKVNDNYGHICGDFVLREFTSRLQKNQRQSDYIFRYGGEEFIILLPQTGIKEALQVAEMIREQCLSQTYDFKKHHLKITVSIGVSSVNEHHPKQDSDLIEFADKALYNAKSKGRNCVKEYKTSINSI